MVESLDHLVLTVRDPGATVRFSMGATTTAPGRRAAASSTANGIAVWADVQTNAKAQQRVEKIDLELGELHRELSALEHHAARFH